MFFSQMIPWIEVLLHTWLDLQRTEDGGRTVNHHGKEVTVGGDDHEKHGVGIEY